MPHSTRPLYDSSVDRLPYDPFGRQKTLGWPVPVTLMPQATAALKNPAVVAPAHLRVLPPSKALLLDEAHRHNLVNSFLSLPTELLQDILHHVMYSYPLFRDQRGKNLRLVCKRFDRELRYSFKSFHFHHVESVLDIGHCAWLLDNLLSGRVQRLCISRICDKSLGHAQAVGQLSPIPLKMVIWLLHQSTLRDREERKILIEYDDFHLDPILQLGPAPLKPLGVEDIPPSIDTPLFGLRHLSLDFKHNTPPSIELCQAINSCLGQTLESLKLSTIPKSTMAEYYPGQVFTPLIDWKWNIDYWMCRTLLWGMKRLTQLEFSGFELSHSPEFDEYMQEEFTAYPRNFHESHIGQLLRDFSFTLSHNFIPHFGTEPSSEYETYGFPPIQNLTLTNMRGSCPSFLSVMFRNSLRHISLLWTGESPYRPTENYAHASHWMYSAIYGTTSQPTLHVETVTLSHHNYDILELFFEQVTLHPPPSSCSQIKTLTFKDSIQNAECNAPKLSGHLFKHVSTLIIPRWWISNLPKTTTDEDESISGGLQLDSIKRIVLYDPFLFQGELEDVERCVNLNPRELVVPSLLIVSQHITPHIMDHEHDGVVEEEELVNVQFTEKRVDLEKWCKSRRVELLRPSTEQVLLMSQTVI